MTEALATESAQKDEGLLASLTGKYLTFSLADEVYGLGILKVQEIIGMMDLTRIPHAPEFIRGVINLRGKVIPVMDLRLKFGLEAKEATEKTCIIVVQVAWAGRKATMGVLVDEVSEVIDIGADQLEPPPSFGRDVSTDFILAMGKVDAKVVVLLDVEKVLSNVEVGALHMQRDPEASQ